MLSWHPYAVPGLLSAAFSLALGVLVYRARPNRAQNRWLAAMLVTNSLIATSMTFGPILLKDHPRLVAALWSLFFLTLLTLPVVYLRFLGTLDSPLVAPFRKRGVQRGLLAYTLLAEAFFIARPDLFLVVIEPEPALASGWRETPGTLFAPLYLLTVGVFLYGLAVAVSAYRNAQTPARRSQAGFYAAAFGTRDVVLALSVTFFSLTAALGPERWRSEASFVNAVVIPLGDLLWVLLLAYGILRSQLFDIDLKLKWTLRQSTLAGTFVAVFFVVSESTAALLQGSIGTYLGIAAAGVLLFALAPLQRAVERLSDAAMPRVNPTDEYLTYRKLEVYKEALEAAYLDGEVTGKERDILARLQAKLAIAPETAATLEEDVKRGLRPALTEPPPA